MLVMTVTSLLFAPSSAGKVTMLNKPKDGGIIGTVVVEAGPAQRCHSFAWFGDDVTLAKWKGLHEHALLVFFAEFDCVGDYTTVFAGERDQQKFYDAKLEKRIQSIMLWESGIYPTRGIVDRPKKADKLEYESYRIGVIGISSSENGSSVGDDDAVYTVNATDLTV